MEDLILAATQNLSDILRESFHLTPQEQAVVIYDSEAPLTRILTEGYRNALPTGRFVDFTTLTIENVPVLFDSLKPGDIVILVQSTNFRINEFRVRIELFKRELKTIEHIHLARMSEEQFGTYIGALSYDPQYYRPLGHALKAKLDVAQSIVVECEDTKLVYTGPMEETKLNVGDYTGMKNTGGTFPIGEVFTELKNLKQLKGTARIFGFAGEDHIVRTYDPFLIHVEDGILTAPNGPPDFQWILGKIKEDEEILVREFGLGLNRAMDKAHIVNDITAYERQKGLHLSLGAKHAMYNKPGLGRKTGRYHVDIFVDVQRIIVDDEVLFENGMYVAENQ